MPPASPAVFTRWLDAEAIKTPEFALTEWFDDQGGVSARMLFDHRTDKDETVNVAESSDYADSVESLHQALMTHISERNAAYSTSPRITRLARSPSCCP